MTYEIRPLIPVPKLTKEDQIRIYDRLMKDPQQSRTKNSNSYEKELGNLIIEDLHGLTYHQSLARLRSDGYERHLRPSEVFGIITGYLSDNEIERKKFLDIGDAILSHSHNRWEWLSLAVQLEDSVLKCYVDPEVVNVDAVLDSLPYSFTKENIRYSGLVSFNVPGIPLQKNIYLEDLPEDLVKFLYGKSFNELPNVMQNGDKRSRIWVGSSAQVDEIFPVTRINYELEINAVNRAISRGVKIKK